MADARPDLCVFETPSCTASQASGYRLPGYLIVEVRGEAERLSQLTAAERADLSDAVAEAERLVHELVAPERVYVAKYAELNPRVHVHVIPRTAALGAAYAAATGDAPPFNGAALTAWLWEHHAGLGHTDAELTAFVERARAAHAAR